MSRNTGTRTRKEIYEQVYRTVASVSSATKIRNVKPYIFCEGQTERYFIENVLKFNKIEYQFDPKYRATSQLPDLNVSIKTAINQGVMIYCFFDLDRIIFNNKTDAEEQKYKELIEDYKNNPMVVFCEALPSIEYWLTLNYENLPFDFPLGLVRQSRVESFLKLLLPNYKKGIPKEGTDHDWYPNFANDAKLSLAMERSKIIKERIDNGEQLSFSNAFKFFENCNIHSYK